MTDKQVREKVFELAAEKNNMSASKVEEMHTFLWYKVAEIITYPTYPDITLTYFGKFSIDIGRLRTNIHSVISRYKRGKVSYEACCTTVQRLWPIYKIKNEQRVAKIKDRTLKYGDGNRRKQTTPW